MKYLQIREVPGYVDGPVEELLVVGMVAAALWDAWFPDETKQPVEADRDNWEQIAMADAEVAVRALVSMGLLQLSDGVMVDDPEQETNDERNI